MIAGHQPPAAGHQPPATNRVLLMSGGVDCAALWWVLDKPMAMYAGGFYGPAVDSNIGEYNAVRYLQKHYMKDRLLIVEHDFRSYFRKGVWEFPREQLLCILAWARGFDTAVIGWVADDEVSGAMVEKQRQRFIGAVAMPGFDVLIPAWNISKASLVRMALERGADEAFFRATYSCTQRSRPCGKCKSCVQRKDALAANGIRV